MFLLLSSADFFQNYFFQKILSGTLSECQTVWIQTVCKGYQQTTKVASCKERVKTVRLIICPNCGLQLSHYVNEVLFANITINNENHLVKN